ESHVAFDVDEVQRCELLEGPLLRLGHATAAAHERDRFFTEGAGFWHPTRVSARATAHAAGSVTKSMSSSTRPSRDGSRSRNVVTRARMRCQARAMSA